MTPEQNNDGKLRAILHADDGMCIMHAKYGSFETVLIDPPNFSTIHVSHADGVVSIYIRDHATITIDGKFHETPTIVVDSDEYPTNVLVKQTESKRVSARSEGADVLRCHNFSRPRNAKTD